MKRKRSYREPRNAYERELLASWQKIVSASQAPLERGAVAKGSAVVSAPDEPPARMSTSLRSGAYDASFVGSLPMGKGGGGTVPAVDPLHEVKRELAGRTGQAYNKGGIQYLSDADLQEQRSGSHRRR